MLSLVPAKESHLDDITTLFLSTGYWNAGLKRNPLGLSSHDFMKQFVTKPFLPFTTVAIDSKGKSIGVVVGSSKQELVGVYQSDESAELDPIIAELFKNLSAFEINESYHISFLAVDKSFRNQGIGNSLFKYAEAKGKKLGFDVLSLYTISCQTSSIRFYLNQGMIITNVIAINEKLPFPGALYFEKSLDLMLLHDYFETEAYQSLDLWSLE